MTKRMAVLIAVMGLMVMVFAGAAFAVTRVGDAGPNRLVGTAENDVLKGRAGADTQVGVCSSAAGATTRSTPARAAAPRTTGWTAAPAVTRS
jgi:hypothetical protein